MNYFCEHDILHAVLSSLAGQEQAKELLQEQFTKQFALNYTYQSISIIYFNDLL